MNVAFSKKVCGKKHLMVNVHLRLSTHYYGRYSVYKLTTKSPSAQQAIVIIHVTLIADSARVFLICTIGLVASLHWQSTVLPLSVMSLEIKCLGHAREFHKVLFSFLNTKTFFLKIYMQVTAKPNSWNFVGHSDTFWIPFNKTKSL